jgi:RNA polymerase sigma factor (sigma-70 family)
MDKLKRFAKNLAPIAGEPWEDVLSETFLRIIEHPKSFIPGTNIEAYAYVVMRRVCLHVRRRKNKYRMVDMESVSAEVSRAMARPGAAEASVEISLALDTVSMLPAQYQRTFRMMAIEGLTQSEAADMECVSPVTARSRNAYVRRVIAEGTAGRTTKGERRRAWGDGPAPTPPAMKLAPPRRPAGAGLAPAPRPAPAGAPPGPAG